MKTTTRIIENSFNYARNKLYQVGLLDEGLGLDVIDLVEALIPSLFGEAGYFFPRGTDGLTRLVGFKEGTIYLPSTRFKDIHLTKSELKRTILHEFGHAWEWYDQKYFKKRWFKKAFEKGYWEERKCGPELFQVFSQDVQVFKESPYYDLYITPYAISSPAEDFAETFSYLLDNDCKIECFKKRKGVYQKMKVLKEAIESWKLK
ncbi:MAG: hypothetical protein KAG61_05755 [Bacteriovoracaceae bacterium]|nr:hypothetical protein [Bacteriovoracaceae bacterium]